MSEKEMGKRIRELRLSQNMTLEQVATVVGVGKSTVRKWETGEIANMRRDKIASLAMALHTTPEFLMGWSTSGDTDSNNIFSIPGILPIPKTKKVPRLGTIACGEPILAEENIESYDQAPEGVNCDFTLRCKGDSMIGARINDGDIVYVRQQKEVENGEIAAVLIDDCEESSATLKRVYLYDNQIVLQAENPKYQPIVLIGEDMNRVRIVGKAVAFLSGVK